MKHDQWISQTIEFVRETLAGAEGGHDWFHIERVWKTTQTIAAQEPVDRTVAELAALLHDIADAKFHGGNDEVGPAKAGAFLASIDVPVHIAAQVVQIIRDISFKGGRHEVQHRTPELDVVQDADRLDAIGAIGIARAFSFGGYKQRALYDPSVPPDMHMDAATYRKSTAPTINHFYEKLLLLKDRMNTVSGRKMAEQRHRFMEQYLGQFYAEWEGQR